MIRYVKQPDNTVLVIDDGRPDVPRARWSSHRVRRFRRLWASLHWHALRRGWPSDAWFARFERRIGCGQCRAHWREHRAAHAIGDGDPFAWTVAAHAACGGDAMTVDAARARWAR